MRLRWLVGLGMVLSSVVLAGPNSEAGVRATNPIAIGAIDLGTGFHRYEDLNALVLFDEASGQFSVTPFRPEGESSHPVFSTEMLTLGSLPEGEVPRAVFGRYVYTLSRVPVDLVLCYRILTVDGEGVFRVRELRYTMPGDDQTKAHLGAKTVVSLGEGRLSFHEDPLGVSSVVVNDLSLATGEKIVGAASVAADDQKVILFSTRSFYDSGMEHQPGKINFHVLEYDGDMREYYARANHTIVGAFPVRYSGIQIDLEDGIPVILYSKGSRSGLPLVAVFRYILGAEAITYSWYCFLKEDTEFFEVSGDALRYYDSSSLGENIAVRSAFYSRTKVLCAKLLAD